MTRLPAARMQEVPADYRASARPEMLPFVPASARRVLEVGCGEGAFGVSLKARGAEVWGIEIDGKAAAQARSRLDRVIVGDISAAVADLPDGRFDCIVCNDVLEHLVDPYSLLDRLRSKLAPDGVVVASIPNIRYFPTLFDLVVRRDWRYEDYGILDKTHLRFFTERSVRATFEGLGYQVVRLQGIVPYVGRRFRLLNAVLFGALDDTRWLQFAVVARPAASDEQVATR